MKITKLQVQNYRTLEAISLEFPSYYSAICGRNDSGKTNVVKVVRSLMRDEDPFYPFRDEEVSFKDDFTKWRDSEAQHASIIFNIEIEVDDIRDTALYQFIITHLKIENAPNLLKVEICSTYVSEGSTPNVTARVLEKKYEGLEAEEVLKRIQTSNSIFVHNSTEPTRFLRYADEYGGLLKEYIPGYKAVTQDITNTVNKKIRSAVKDPQKEISELLGRLNEKYKVGISVPRVEFDFIPLNITLGDRKIDVPLKEWGSGTKNRTLILMTLFRARQISQSETTSDKITPVIIIEEPESFLHPSAQAEFGQILQDLSEEFEVQVLVTTHSPYLLSHDNPQSNILLERNITSNQLRESRVVEIDEKNWMEPFGLSLGVISEELKPWKNLFFSKSDKILLVEGDVDKKYFELLRDDAHGNSSLSFNGEIYAYGGTGNIKNNVLLRFITDRYKKVFITYDLDEEESVEKFLKALSLKKNADYIAIGKNQAGKKNIEGLLPDSVTSEVYSNNPGLVQQVAHGTKEEQRSAKNQLKQLYLQKFMESAKPGTNDYKEFYAVAKKITKALK
jgi:putative ATP-dependent endonuclease of the OLD family